MSLDDENITTQLKVLGTKEHMIIWADLFECMIFTAIASNVYNAIIIEYNSYKDYRFKFQYMNGTSEYTWRG
jgi:hypothetical protein